MNSRPINARRIVAGIFLGAALLMLYLGLTWFSDELEGVNYATYWLTCFLFTGLAAITALLDMALLRRQLRREQRDLIANTLAEAQSEQARSPSKRK